MTVAFSPSGNRLAVVAATYLVRILDAGDGKELLSHDQDDARHASAVFSNDGKLIASPQGRRTVELWDAANGRTIRRFEIPEQPGKGFGPDGRIVNVELGVDPQVGGFSPDGSLLTVEVGSQVVLFDVTTGKPRLSVPLEGGGAGGLPGNCPAVLALNASVLATAYFSKTIVLWDLKTGKKLRELTPRVGAVSALSISPDGRTLASCTGYWGGREGYSSGALPLFRSLTRIYGG